MVNGSSDTNMEKSLNETTSTGEGTPQRHLMLHWEQFALILSCTVLSLVIIFGNVLVMAAFRINSRLRTGTYKFLASLALSDFLVGSISLPMWIYISTNPSRLPSQLMTVYLTLDIFSSMASISHLMAISVERFIAVSRPFLFERLSGRQYNLTLMSVWLYGAVVGALFPIQKQLALRKMYAPAIFAAGFALPLLIISAMYVGTFRVARRLIHLPPPHLFGESEHENEKKLMQQEYKVALTLFIITSLFFLLWLPQFTTTMVAAFGMLRLPKDEVGRIVATSKFLHYLNSALNPFVYAYRDKEMRRTFKRLLTCV